MTNKFLKKVADVVGLPTTSENDDNGPRYHDMKVPEPEVKTVEQVLSEKKAAKPKKVAKPKKKRTVKAKPETSEKDEDETNS